MMPNWALDAIERLTLAADIRILTFLTRHRHYRSNTYSTRQLAIALEIDLRTIQSGAGRLSTLGLILGIDGQFCSSEASTRLQGVRKGSAKGLQKDSPSLAENYVLDSVPGSLKKGTDEVKKKGSKTNPPTPQGEARNVTAPVVQDQTPVQRPEPMSSPDGEAADAAPVIRPVQGSAQIPTRQTEQAMSTEKVPAARRRVAAPAEPTAFQALFGAVALACYGGHDELTNSARSRVAAASKSLSTAGYVAADIPQIVAWVHASESYRTGNLTPQVVEERAPAWRGAVRGSLPARPDRAHVLKFPAPAPPLDNGEIDMDALIRNAPLNGTRRNA